MKTELLIPLEKLIASKDILAQCKKTHKVFTLFEQAGLIYRNPMLTNEEKLKFWKLIQEVIRDDNEYKELNRQLEDRIRFQEELEKKFYTKEENQYFMFSFRYAGCAEYFNDDRLFSDLQKVIDYADNYFKLYKRDTGSTQPSHNGEFIIHKRYLNNENRIDVVFNSQKKIQKISSVHLEPVKFGKYDNFARAFIPVPYPFKNGDIVCSIEDSQIGIFSTYKNPQTAFICKHIQDEVDKTGQNISVSDNLFWVEFLKEENENPDLLYFDNLDTRVLPLEYAKINESDKHYKLLKMAQDLMLGKGSLKSFCDYFLHSYRNRLCI